MESLRYHDGDGGENFALKRELKSFQSLKTLQPSDPSGVESTNDNVQVQKEKENFVVSQSSHVEVGILTS